MWYLISLASPDVKHVFLGGKTYIVGRRDCDVLITGDATVSRRHSELSVSHTESNLGSPDKVPVLLLKDLSKFGTWVNKEKVSSEKILKDGDSIIFGSPKSTFTVVYEPLVVTTSCLDPAAKKSVRAKLCLLGGHMINDWKPDCSLLVMTKITVTIKVICALVSLKPIVSPKYLEAYVKYLQGTSEKPDPSQFLPNVAESQLDPTEASFALETRRKTLFEGKTFVFLSQKQYKKMSMAIELAGGTSLVMEDRGDTDLLTEPGTVVMSCQGSDLSPAGQKWFTKVQNILKRASKKLIQDAEIGYAVLYCSTAKHCNPDSGTIAGTQGLPSVVSQSLTQADMFVPNSEPPSRDETETRHGNIIPGPSRRSNRSEKISPVRKTSPSSVTALGSPETRSVFSKPRSRSPSPKPKSRSPSPKPKSRSPEKRLALDKSQHSPVIPVTETLTVKQEVPSQPSQTISRKRGRFVIEEDDDDDLTFGKRVKQEPVTPQSKVKSSRGRVTEPEPSVKSEIILDSNDDGTEVIKPKTKSSKTSPTKLQVRVSPKPSPPPSPVRRSRRLSPSPSPAKRDPSPTEESVDDARDMAALQSRLKKEAKEDESGQGHKVGVRGSVRKQEVGFEDVEEREQRTKSSVLQADVPDGFLSTRIPIQDQIHSRVVQQKDEDGEQNLPVNCMNVDVVSLVVRKPPTSSKKVARGHCPEGFVRWKGRLVRNFKKFRKVQNQGAGSLPRIIGGSDLVIHEREPSKEMDEWFKDALEAESQHASEDRQARELFDWNPSDSRKRSR